MVRKPLFFNDTHLQYVDTQDTRLYTCSILPHIYIVSRNEERWRAEYKKIITEGDSACK
jgi:hypothetical protein